ncbi:BamA/TamA family outer membrane protein [Argonema antarcticum]|uniref:BamA/TamA family outer membrane protein n=1 Tax=Argonema antarcticum TaxID=2942763 RepID=UPI002010F603|nr:BamA/TamA family outer membrane protein [Argonema antarcticum]MCL1471746.1 BamA/TamA family outer membrane protein [Argonema antarcticum A004/B2]
MRLSPVLVVAITWATLGLQHSANGQTSDSQTGIANNLSFGQEFTHINTLPLPDRQDLGLTAHSGHIETVLAENFLFEVGTLPHSKAIESLQELPNLPGQRGRGAEEQRDRGEKERILASSEPISSNSSSAPSAPNFGVTGAPQPPKFGGLQDAEKAENPFHPESLLLNHFPPESQFIAQTTDRDRPTNTQTTPRVEPTAQTQPAPAEDTPPRENPEPETPTNVESTPATPPSQGVPPQGTPAPEQETPNQLELNLTPGGRSPANPQIDIPERAPSTPPINVQPSEAPPVDSRVLVAEVLVNGVEGRLQSIVYDAIRTRPGRTTTRSQLQEDINAVFATGYFSKVRAEPSDTPLGVRVTFVVESNPVLRSVQVEGNQALPQTVVQETFRSQYNDILNFRDLQEGIKRLEQWYKDKGYVLAQVVDTRVNPDGTVTLSVAEGVVENIQVRFLNKEGEATNEQGQPIRGRTRSYIVTRELALKPGQVFNRNEVQRDLQRVFRLGLFEDVQVSLNPGQDPRRVNVIVNVKERNAGSIAAGAGISSASGLFGTVSYQQQNLGGNNQKLGAEVQLGQRELLFDLRFTDPWIGGDPYRTSYTVNFFRRRSISLIFDGGDPEVRLPNDDRPRILRIGGGVTFNRPLSKNPLAESEWVSSLGLQYQRVSIRDRDGDISPVDELGNDLSFSGEGKDDLVLVQLGLVRDRRNNPLRTTSGSLLRFGLEQSVPIGLGNVFLTRLRGSYSYYIPVKFTNFTTGAQALAFNVQGGTVLGDLPPYEAFSLGGSNSVRGYEEGDLGSGRSYIQATAEYRFPVFSVVGGALFVDFGTDIGSGGSVLGDPAGVRGKPGTGFGYGLGVRIQSPLGPIRIDYGLNDNGDSRIHFGIGERF